LLWTIFKFVGFMLPVYCREEDLVKYRGLSARGQGDINLWGRYIH
jgi:hypothetical protein